MRMVGWSLIVLVAAGCAQMRQQEQNRQLWEENQRLQVRYADLANQPSTSPTPPPKPTLYGRIVQIIDKDNMLAVLDIHHSYADHNTVWIIGYPLSFGDKFASADGDPFIYADDQLSEEGVRTYQSAFGQRTVRVYRFHSPY